MSTSFATAWENTESGHRAPTIVCRDSRKAGCTGWNRCPLDLRTGSPLDISAELRAHRVLVVGDAGLRLLCCRPTPRHHADTATAHGCLVRGACLCICKKVGAQSCLQPSLGNAPPVSAWLRVPRADTYSSKSSSAQPRAAHSIHRPSHELMAATIHGECPLPSHQRCQWAVS